MRSRARLTDEGFVCADEGAPPERRLPKGADREPRQKRFLLVEDEPLVRSAVKRMLGALYPDFAIVEARDGDEAIDLLDDDIVCVVSDIDMPNRDGIQMCWSIRHSAACGPWSDVPVILISATCYSEEFMLEAWGAGTAHLIKKPFDPTELARVIDGAIGARDGGASMAPSVERRALEAAPRRLRLTARAGGCVDER